jgi:hypothetical protein
MTPCEEVLLVAVDGIDDPLRLALRRAWRSGETVRARRAGGHSTCRVVDFAEVTSGTEVQVMVTLVSVS